MKKILKNSPIIDIHVVGQGKNSIKLSDILYVEAQMHCIFIHTNNGIIKSNYSLAEVEDMLQEESFYRCHKSYIVNINEICFYKGTVIHMSNGEIVYISRRRLREFKKMYFRQMNEITILKKLNIL